MDFPLFYFLHCLFPLLFFLILNQLKHLFLHHQRFQTSRFFGFSFISFSLFLPFLFFMAPGATAMATKLEDNDKRPRSNEEPDAVSLYSPFRVPADVLIPIRLDVTVDNHHIQETFSWNPNEKHMTPKLFAAMFCADLNLPSSAQEAIVEQMNEQISAHEGIVTATATSMSPSTSNSKVGHESRHIVRLDVRIGRVVVRDQFEWDLSETMNSADSFAERLCADLGLNTEHVPTVAHAVREQLVELAEFQDKRQGGPQLGEHDVVRPLSFVDAWQPTVECLTVEEQEKLERKEKREARLQRRNRGKADIYSRANGRTSLNRGRTGAISRRRRGYD